MCYFLVSVVFVVFVFPVICVVCEGESQGNVFFSSFFVVLLSGPLLGVYWGPLLGVY